MNNRTAIEKCFIAIMALPISNEFKVFIERLHTFHMNKEAYSLTDSRLPHYLWIAKRGGGVSTLVKIMTEYLYAARSIEFCGAVKSFEFKLEYIAPNEFFSELSRLDNSLIGFAGHNRYYKGVLCICVDEWVEHTSEDYFATFLSYISSKSDQLHVIFSVNVDTVRSIETLEAALSAYMRIEPLVLHFPNPRELVEIMEAQYINNKGFILSEDAKALLCCTIEELSASKAFNGFKTISQLANDILYSILSTDLYSKRISAEMLSGYGKDSSYVKRASTQSGTKSIIGFAERGG